MVCALTRDPELASLVQIPSVPLSCNDAGQVVHTHVPLSLSSIIWYWPNGGDVFRLGR